MFKKILLVLAVIILVFVAVVWTRPDEFRVERSITISAQPEAVFPHVNNLHNWKAWSPWAKLDPNAKETFQGPAEGKDAHFAWAGNHEVGEGSMTVTESRPNESIRFRLDFVKPFRGTNTAEFMFRSEGEKTLVIWSMFGKSNFIAKAVGLFMNCDKMVGGQFEKGLADLKTVTEQEKPILTAPL